MLNKDIIPITYMGGTGGQFLCHFIVSAKRNIKDRLVNLSEHGNAHSNNLSDIPSSPNLGVELLPDIDKINYIFSKDPNVDAILPYYTAAHIVDIDLINNNFKNSIRITYEIDDIEEINTIMFGKTEQKKVWEIGKKPFYFKSILESSCSLFFKKENMPNVLFVSWKELFKGNDNDLIQKISIFTDINFYNFSKDSLNHWRNKTQYCIDKFSQY